MAPEYARVAAEAAKWEIPVFLAKVDTTKYPMFAGRYGVQGFPTLKFFNNQ